MKTVKINGILFKGQYAENVEWLLRGDIIDINDFKNGSWEATREIKRFIRLLNEANIVYTLKSNEKESIRSFVITNAFVDIREDK